MLKQEQLQRCTHKTYSKSSGPGGQNVNKTSTRVQLECNLRKLPLSPEKIQRILRKYPDGFIHVSNQETRYQPQNTKLAFEHLAKKIEDALFVSKPRKQRKSPHLTKMGKIRTKFKERWFKYKNRYLDH